MYSHELNNNILVTYETDMSIMCNCYQTATLECLEHAGKFEMDSEFGSGIFSIPGSLTLLKC